MTRKEAEAEARRIAPNERKVVVVCRSRSAMKWFIGNHHQRDPFAWQGHAKHVYAPTLEVALEKWRALYQAEK